MAYEGGARRKMPVFLLLGWVVTTPEGSQQAFLTGLARLSNLLPY